MHIQSKNNKKNTRKCKKKTNCKSQKQKGGGWIFDTEAEKLYNLLKPNLNDIDKKIIKTQINSLNNLLNNIKKIDYYANVTESIRKKLLDTLTKIQKNDSIKEEQKGTKKQENINKLLTNYSNITEQSIKDDLQNNHLTKLVNLASQPTPSSQLYYRR